MRPTLSLLFVALATLLLAAPASASPHLDWTPCKPGFECATAKVPLDYDHPSGRKIELALTRARAADPATRIGSVFVHDGGPGVSNVDFIQAAPPAAIAAITRRYDVIGIDTRGSATAGRWSTARSTRSAPACTRSRSGRRWPSAPRTTCGAARSSTTTSSST
jgi:hypothetical protein